MENHEIYVLKELDQYVSLTEYLQSQGHTIHYLVLQQEIIEANRWISKKLQIPLTAKVFSFKKLRIVDNEPKSIDHVYLAYDRVVGIERRNLADRSFYSVLKEHYNLKVVRNEEELAIAGANKIEAELLHLNEGDEVFIAHGSTFVNTFEPLEYFEITAIPSFYRYRSVSTL